MLRNCGQWYCGLSFVRFCVKGHMIFAGPCGEGCQFRQVAREGGLRGSCTAPPYGAVHIPVLLYFPASSETGLQSLRSWGYISLGGFGFDFDCPEFFGLEISLGD